MLSYKKWCILLFKYGSYPGKIKGVELKVYIEEFNFKSIWSRAATDAAFIQIFLLLHHPNSKSSIQLIRGIIARAQLWTCDSTNNGIKTWEELGRPLISKYEMDGSEQFVIFVKYHLPIPVELGTYLLT